MQNDRALIAVYADKCRAKLQIDFVHFPHQDQAKNGDGDQGWRMKEDVEQVLKGFIGGWQTVSTPSQFLQTACRRRPSDRRFHDIFAVAGRRWSLL